MKISILRTALIAVGVVLFAAPALANVKYHGFQGEGAGYVPFMDVRTVKLQPSPAQLEAALALPATIRWNEHGTPKVMLNRKGYLSAPRSGAPVDIARDFLRSQSAVLGVSLGAINSMEVLRVSPLHESPEYARMLRGEPVATANVPHVVLFRQVFDGLSAGARDGLVTVGVTRDGRVAFVGSTLSRATGTPQGAVRLSQIDAILASATDVGMNVGVLELIASPQNDFDTYSSSILSDVQRVRSRALPVAGVGLRRVYEVTLLDTSHDRGHPQAFISFVDVETGRVWVRDNAVQHLADEPVRRNVSKVSVGQITGSTPAGECGPRHAFAVDADNDVLEITMTATSIEDPGAATGAAPEPADIYLDLFFGGVQVAHQDLLGSPETLVYQPNGGLPEGDYELLVCPYNGSAAPPIDYVGAYTATPGSPAGVPGSSSPAWRIFPNSPVPARFGPDDAAIGEDVRENWCWDVAGNDPLDDGDLGRDPSQCDRLELRNIAARAPWDALADGTPTMTTHGNNASTAVSNVNFVAPDTVPMRPVSPDRSYDFAFTNAWYDSACDPTVFVDPSRNQNDYEAATVNLFAMHNRMHDWSYLLGWTEVNSNLQFDNYGLTAATRENDPELGSSQAGRATINGRDNANQLTLQDGVPGVTNQYLWQALPGVIYPAGCVDGAYDMVIIAHEYTHATTNRMTGGPDASLGGEQASAMGEAWGDLAGIEYVQSYGIAPVGKESLYAAAVYVTGDPEAGIRNYGIDKNPLNFGDFDYDGNGEGSPHANSEIWGGTMYSVRKILTDKYEAQYPFEDRALQVACADGKISSQACPGNRRWVQLMYDGLLLQPAAPSMLDARDAIIAADLLRYNGANQVELWEAFASRGMGGNAFSDGGNDFDTIPHFASPLRNNNANIRFTVAGTDGSTPVANIYTGQYEARVSPTADTDPATDTTTDSMQFVPGEYEFVVQAPGYGLQRFKRSFAAGQSSTVNFSLRPNLASSHRGAIASGDGDTPEDLLELIDDTEATNWASTSAAGTASEGKGEGALVEGRQVTVQLSERSRIRDVQVSALQSGQNRFTALRSFDLLSCDASTADCSQASNFQAWYASADDAFNGRWLRPKSPHLLLRSFPVPEVTATHVKIVVRDNQCTGGPDFQGDANPSGDPTNDPDCDSGSNAQLTALALPDSPVNNGELVYIAELQVFADAAPATDSGNGNDGGSDGGSDGSDGGSGGASGTRGGAAGWLVLLLLAAPTLRRRRAH